MSDQFNYLVLGAGRQGTAAAYDLVRWGDARQVIVADSEGEVAHKAAERVNDLTGTEAVSPVEVNVRDLDALKSLLDGADACISAVPYRFNLDITRIAVLSGSNYCDLGGNTDIARQQHQFSDQAKEAGISIVPNCGQVPGMGTTLMVYAMGLLDRAVDVFMWDGGIPQNPRPPFNY